MITSLELPAGHLRTDTHPAGVSGAPTSPDPTSHSTAPMTSSSGPVNQTPEQTEHLPEPRQDVPAQGPNSLTDQTRNGTPLPFVGEGPNSLASHVALATQDSHAGEGPDDRQAAATLLAVPNGHALQLADPTLALAADIVDDLERVRIANENRLRQLTRTATDKDGEDRGFGLPDDHPLITSTTAVIATLKQAEHQAELNLKRAMRRHPLGPWVKQTKGLGEKTIARLLAAIGDPYWNDLHNRPRTVSELWAYSGYHVLRTGHWGIDTQAIHAGSAQLPAGHGTFDTQRARVSGAQTGSNLDQATPGDQACCVGVAASRSRGQRANWSATAKMRAYLIADTIVQVGGPYREVYDQGRKKYADAVHKVECKRCGPTGKPALIGSPLSAGHQHARAVRLIAKEVLKDLWREAKRLHEEAAV